MAMREERGKRKKRRISVLYNTHPNLLAKPIAGREKGDLEEGKKGRA